MAAIVSRRATYVMSGMSCYLLATFDSLSTGNQSDLG
jgi:hypothetical protein